MSNKQQSPRAGNIGSRTTTNRYCYIYVVRRLLHHAVGTRISYGSWLQPSETNWGHLKYKREFTGRKSGTHRTDGEVANPAWTRGWIQRQSVWKAREWREAWPLLCWCLHLLPTSLPGWLKSLGGSSSAGPLLRAALWLHCSRSWGCPYFPPGWWGNSPRKMGLLRARQGQC